MKKYLLISLLVGLTALPSAAQFAKHSLKAAANMKNLERIPLLVERAAARPRVGASIVAVPKGLVNGNKVLLTPSALPWRKTPAGESLALYQKTLQETHPTALDKQTMPTLEQAWLEAGGKAFYTDQTTLARALENFYGGKSTIMRSPEGKMVRIYALPVDGILYKPVGYTEPVVLQAKDDCVVYDIETREGKLISNTPDLYTLFRPYFAPDATLAE